MKGLILKHCGLIALLLLGFSSCDIFDQFFTPDNGNDQSGTVLDSIVVGPGGGILKTDSVEVIVPENAFSNQQSVSLVRLETDSIPVEGAISNYYCLRGITEDVTQPITIKMRTKQPIESSDVGIVVFESGLDYSSDDYSRCPLISSYSDGWLTCKVVFDNTLEKVPSSTASKSGKAKYDYSWFALTASKHETIHFNIYYEAKQGVDKIQKVGEYLENSLNTFISLGFSHSISHGEVYVWKMKDYGGVSQSRTTGKIWMEINDIILNDTEELKVTLGHETFHWVQYNYDKAFWAGLKNVWLDEAFAVWSETLFASSANHYPKVITGNEGEPFQGIQMGATRLVGDLGSDNGLQTDHGYGMASLIKYLVKKYGTTLPINVYEEIKKGTHPVFALHKMTNYHLEIDYELFLNDLMLGHLFNNPYNNFYKIFYGKYEIADKLELSSSDTIISFVDDYPDLSAKVYRVEFGTDFLKTNPDAKLKFKLTSFIDKNISMEGVYIYKVNKDKIELLGNTIDSLVVGNFSDALYLYAMVVNSNFSDLPQPYTNQRGIKLTIETVGYRAGCQGGLLFDAVMKIDNAQGVKNDTTTDFMILFPYIESATASVVNLAYVQGDLTGNVYKAEWNKKVSLDATSDYSMVKGQLQIEFNETHSLIKDFILVDTTQYVSSNGNNFYYEKIHCVNIPYGSISGDEKTFSIEGSAVLGSIKSINYHELYYDGSTRELINYSTSNGSLISVIFKGQILP